MGPACGKFPPQKDDPSYKKESEQLCHASYGLCNHRTPHCQKYHQLPSLRLQRTIAHCEDFNVLLWLIIAENVELKRNHNLTLCCLLDYAPTMLKIRFLICHGFVCTTRSNLARHIMSSEFVFPFIRENWVANLDSAIWYGRIEDVQFYLEKRDEICRYDIENKTWNDPLVCIFLTKYLDLQQRLRNVRTYLQFVLQNELLREICEYLSMDTIGEVISYTRKPKVNIEGCENS